MGVSPVADVDLTDETRQQAVMMGWTEADGNVLFRQPSDEQAGEDASSGSDDR